MKRKSTKAQRYYLPVYTRHIAPWLLPVWMLLQKILSIQKFFKDLLLNCFMYVCISFWIWILWITLHIFKYDLFYFFARWEIIKFPTSCIILWKYHVKVVNSDLFESRNFTEKKFWQKTILCFQKIIIISDNFRDNNVVPAVEKCPR